MNRLLVLIKPPFGPELLDILTPNLLIPMDRKSRNAKYRSFRESLATNDQTAFWYQTREANAGGRVDTECLVDAGVEVGEEFDLIAGSDEEIFRAELLVKFLVEFSLCVGVMGEVVDDGTRRTMERSKKNGKETKQ